MTLKIVKSSLSRSSGNFPRIMAFWDAKAGLVCEVNLSGLSIEYVGLTSNDCDTLICERKSCCLDKIDIVTDETSITLQSVPVDEMSDKEIGPYAGSGLLKNRHCRIRFGRLTTAQKKLLCSFLADFSTQTS